MRLILLAAAILFLSGCEIYRYTAPAPNKEMPCWMTEESPESNYWISSK